MSVKIGRNDPCWCGSGRKYKACHEAFDEKIARYASQGHIVPQRNIIKNAEQIAGIKESCKINIAVLDYIEKNIHEGMNTAEIDKIVYDMTTSMGGIPAPLNYEGYPFSVCTSVNDQVCHGFPSKDVILKAGDIINVDATTILDGYYADASRMFIIGKTTPEKEKLVLSARQVAKEAAIEERNHKISMIVPGTVLEGTVESLMPYGAFINLGNGLSGLVHISQICERRIKKPSEVLKEGQKVKAKVLNTNDNKISLSMKALEEEMVDTEPAEDLEQYTSKESFGSSLGSLLAGIKLD